MMQTQAKQPPEVLETYKGMNDLHVLGGISKTRMSC